MINYNKLPTVICFNHLPFKNCVKYRSQAPQIKTSAIKIKAEINVTFKFIVTNKVGEKTFTLVLCQRGTLPNQMCQHASGG